MFSKYGFTANRTSQSSTTPLATQTSLEGLGTKRQSGWPNTVKSSRRESSEADMDMIAGARIVIESDR